MNDLLMENKKTSESIVFKGFNGGSGWTRTTDLTLIRATSRNKLIYKLEKRWIRKI